MEFKEAFKTTTMFLTDSLIEAHYEDFLNTQIKLLKQKLSGIGTQLGLEFYIKSESDSIDKIITLLGISNEKFKRVVSCIRLNYGYTFESEWTTTKLRSELIVNPQLMKEYCELFTSGYVSSKFAAIIPRFILQDFRIDSEIVARLNNDDYIRNLIKDKITTEYNARYCDLYYKKLDSKIENIAHHYGLKYDFVTLPSFKINPLKVISSLNKHVIINAQFYLTTSSNQTVYYNDYIKLIVQDAQTNPNIIIINFLDGAGWIGRSADYKKIYQDCDYFLNLKTIDKFNGIIKEFFNIN